VQPLQTAGGPSHADLLQQHITAALGQAGVAAAAAAVKALSTAAASDQQTRCSGAAAAGGSRAMAVVAAPDVLAKAVRASEGAATNPQMAAGGAKMRGAGAAAVGGPANPLSWRVL
jgi:hypothetical protein